MLKLLLEKLLGLRKDVTANVTVEISEEKKVIRKQKR